MFLRLATAAAVSVALTTAQATFVSAETGQLTLTASQVERLGIRTAPAAATTRQALVTVPGRVTAPLDTQLTVSVPFAGTVLSVLALEGTPVKAGDTLLTIASSGYLDAVARLAQHKAEYRAAKAAADRLRTLAQEGIVAEARAEEADASVARIKALMDAVEHLLAQVRPVAAQGGVYSLTAPADATIARLEVAPGDMIDAMDGALVLEGSNAVWLEAELPAAFLGQTGTGDGVRIEPDGPSGVIIAIGRNIDAKSRSVTLRATLQDGHAVRPGQSVLATVYGKAPADAVSVPRDAVVRIAGGDVVFLVKSGGFMVLPVTVLSRGTEAAVVTGAIAPGDEVAISGLTELKALALEDM